MKPAIGLLGLGLLLMMLQSALALSVPARFLPDVGLLLVIGIAVRVRSAGLGIVLAVLLGYATDLLSGALLGQHALLRLAVYGATRALAARVNLRGALSLLLYGALACAAQVGLSWLLLAFFIPGPGPFPANPQEALPYALINGVAAPLFTALVGALLARTGDDDPGRPVRLEPRMFPL